MRPMLTNSSGTIAMDSGTGPFPRLCTKLRRVSFENDSSYWLQLVTLETKHTRMLLLDTAQSDSGYGHPGVY